MATMPRSVSRMAELVIIMREPTHVTFAKMRRQAKKQWLKEYNTMPRYMTLNVNEISKTEFNRMRAQKGAVVAENVNGFIHRAQGPGKTFILTLFLSADGVYYKADMGQYTLNGIRYFLKFNFKGVQTIHRATFVNPEEVLEEDQTEEDEKETEDA